MVTWIVVGVVVVAVAVLAGVAMMLLGHLRPLGLAARRLRIRAEQAQQLQGRVATLQQTVATLQGGIEQASRGAEGPRAERRPVDSR